MSDEDIVSRLRLEAVDDTGPVLRNISSQIDQTKRAFETLGSGVLLGKAYNDFANVQRTMERLQFSTGATAQQMKGFGREFDELSKRTGRSVDELAQNFNAFLDLSGQALGPAIEQFKTIADASKVTGVAMENLSRAAAAAVNDMKVPANEVSDLIKRWAVELPSTMLQSFTQMAPRIMQTMEAVGLTGAKNAEEVANAFAEIAKASGSPRAAFMGLNSILNNMNNASSQLGKIMLPVLSDVRAKGGDALAQFDAMYKTLNKMHAFDPAMRPWLQQTLGIDFNTLKTMQTLEDHLGEIRKRMAAGESAAQAMADVLNGFNNDPKSAIDHLRGSVNALSNDFAKMLDSLGASSAMNGLAKTFDNVAKAIDYVESKASSSGNDKINSEYEQAANNQTFSQKARTIITGGSTALGFALGGFGGSFVTPLAGTVGGAALGAGYGYKVGEWGGQKLFGGMSEEQLQAYARAHGLAGPEHHATGGIVTRPTLSTIGENGPEAIVPLTSSGGSGRDNTTATKENTAALNRLSSYMRSGIGHGGRALAYTPGAGELGVSADAEMNVNGFVVGADGEHHVGAGGHGPMFRPGIGPRVSGGYRPGAPGGGQVPRHFGSSGAQVDSSEVNSGAASQTLAQQRAGFMKELNSDPQLRDFAIDAMQHEGGIQSNLEQLFNYAAMRHMTIRQALHSGQYGPVNNGMISGRISEKTRRLGLAALAKVGAGSNITDYATDQGMAGDPNFSTYMSNRSYWDMHKVEGAWFSYHGEAGRRWAERQRAADHAAATKAADNSVWAHGAAPIPHTMLQQHRAMRKEMEKPIRINFEPPSDAGRRARMRTLQARMQGEDMLGTPRWASQLDIGFA